MLVDRLIVAPLSMFVVEVFQGLVHERDFGGLCQICFHGGVVYHYGGEFLLDVLCT